MHEMIKEAQFNVLQTFQATGIKLKLLNALYNGRFCIVNPLMVNNTGLEELCEVCETAEDMKLAINNVINKEFTQQDIDHRTKVLNENFSNKANAERLIKLIYSLPQ